MRKLYDDPANLTTTYELSDGRRLKVDTRVVREFGIERIMRDRGLGAMIPAGRLDVFQDGNKVGTVPASFDPHAIKSTSFFYQPRANDFVREDDKWVADRMLGPGDLEAVPGFVWHRAE